VLTVRAGRAGLFIWTFAEYSLHRWVFHYHPTSELGKKLHFLMHGVHHDYPQDHTRLVMPPPVSIPLAAAFGFLFSWLFGAHWEAIFAGFLVGYVIYDTTHYATHHWKMQSGLGRFLREYHLRHHFRDDDLGYGVSSPLWDYVFGTVSTRPGPTARRRSQPVASRRRRVEPWVLVVRERSARQEPGRTVTSTVYRTSPPISMEGTSGRSRAGPPAPG
jgi:sterol desaturase/sphingolipid hydroxylase (fatty acid hydroxylase superfamily)